MACVENIVVDRSMCTAEGNCYWNVFIAPPPGSQECSRYAGTFAAAALEPLAAKGDDNMSDVRGYWNLHGGRLLLQSYRFVRGGYQLVDALAVQARGGRPARLHRHGQPLNPAISVTIVMGE